MTRRTRTAAGGVLIAAVLVLVVWLVTSRSVARETSAVVEPERAHQVEPTISSRNSVAEVDEHAPERPTGSPFAGGVVVDPEGAPVVGARLLVRGHAEIGGDIVAADIDARATPICTTDASGRFSLPEEPEDIATLVVVASGFEIAEIDAPRPDLRIVLQRCDPFRSRVIDAEGRPVVGAVVVLIGAIDPAAGGRRTSFVARTDADGVVLFDSVPADARVGSILAPGYALPELHDTPFGVELRETYVLARTAVIIDVRDASGGGPVAAARGAAVATAGSVVGALRSAGEVDARLGSLPLGRLIWRPARGCTGLPLTLRVFAPGYVSRSLPLTLSAGVEPPHLEVALSVGDEPPSIAGRVVDGVGTVVTVRARPEYPDGFHLQATDLQLPAVIAAVVGDDGAFAFSGLPPATYCLSAVHPDHSPMTLDVTAPVSGLEIRFVAHAALDVTLRDSEGAPIADAWVHVQTRDERLFWEARTDAAGRAHFERVPAVELDVVPVRNASPIPDVVLDHPAMPRARVAPEDGVFAPVELVHPGESDVSVIVREDTGAPVRDASIRVKLYRGLGAFLHKERQRIEAHEWTTDADGRVVLRLPPCGGSVRVYSGGRSVRAAFSTTDGAIVELRIPTRFGEVRGRVVELGNGVAIVGRPVSVRSDGQKAGGTATDASGSFVVGRVPAGRVKVSVDGRMDEHGARDRESPYAYVSVEFDLAGDEDRSVDIVVPRLRGDDALPATSELRVRVLEEDDRPMDGVNVVVDGEFGAVRAMLADGRTDADGRVTLRLPDADSYSVRAWAGERRASVVLPAVPTDEVDLRLPAAPGR